VGGTGSALEAIRQLGAAYAQKDKDLQLVVLPSIGSAGAIKGLIGQSVDMGLIARPLKDSETAQGLQATRLVQTPVVIVTSKRGEKNITSAQLEAFYSGAITRWSDNSAVRLVLRPLADTDNQLIATLTPGMKAAVELAAAREGLLTASTDQDSADALEKLPGSVGTAALALVLFEKRKLEVLSLNGVAPWVRGKVNSDYPLMKPLYLVSREDTKPAVKKFIQFVQSAAGQAILEKSGYTHEFR
jgi:phosphate transport system substrate-binding protein